MKINWNEEKTEKYFILFGKIMLVAILVFNAWLTYKCYFNFMRSDESSELVYAKLLADEGKIITANWKGSTELEILNNQLVYSLLFHFTSSFKAVRILGQMILSCILVGCYYFFLRGIDCKKASARFWKSAFVLLIPLSDAWLFLVMKAYYIPAVSISFITFGFIMRMLDADTSKKKILLTVSGCVLAFVSSLGGIRHIELTYFPLFLAFCWKWWNDHEKGRWKETLWKLPKGMKCSLIWLGAAGIGYICNISILSKIYQYDSNMPMAFGDTIPLESFENLINAYWKVTGYGGAKELISIGGICNAISVVCGILLIGIMVCMAIKISEKTEKEQIAFGTILLTFALSIFLYFVINMIEPRWLVCSIAPMILMMILLDYMPFRKQYSLLCVIYLIVCLFFLGQENIMLYGIINRMKDSDKCMIYLWKKIILLAMLRSVREI